MQRPGRQAVVIVHGMGEQRPMSTAEGFVDGLAEADDLVFWAPDHASHHSDLRRAKITWLPEILGAEDGSSPLPPRRTDVFELYWANLVTETEWRHLTAWLFGLLRQWPRLTPRLRRFLRFNVGYAAVAAVVAVALLLLSIAVPAVPQALGWIGGLLLPFASGWILWHLGDVARYTHDVGDNVTIQRAVRREGIALLRELHEQVHPGRAARPVYDRIVVVGHSLGSVVAYDIVRGYWTEVYRHFGTDPRTPTDIAEDADAVERLGERLWADPRVAAEGPTEFRAAQRRLSADWSHLVSLPPGEHEPRRWVVTDLVTLACPLTHADVLLAPGPAALENAQWRRRLPTCPPRRQALEATYRFGYARGRRTTRSWHQAAPFAATRWTNLYFPNDSVGGPLRALFGPGIVDIELPRPTGGAGRFPSVHLQYDRDLTALAALRSVIWDGGSRAPFETLHDVRRATLLHVLREVAQLPAAHRGQSLASTPLLRRFGDDERARLAEILERHPAPHSPELETLLDNAIAHWPPLLALVIVAPELLPNHEDGEAPTGDPIGDDEEVEEEAEQQRVEQPEAEEEEEEEEEEEKEEEEEEEGNVSDEEEE